LPESGPHLECPVLAGCRRTGLGLRTGAFDPFGTAGSTGSGRWN
jgi:hypothetical protein